MKNKNIEDLELFLQAIHSIFTIKYEFLREMAGKNWLRSRKFLFFEINRNLIQLVHD